MLLRGRAPLAVAMTASAQPNKVLTPRTTVARSKSGVSGRNIMYFIRGVSDHPRREWRVTMYIQLHGASIANVFPVSVSYDRVTLSLASRDRTRRDPPLPLT